MNTISKPNGTFEVRSNLFLRSRRSSTSCYPIQFSSSHAIGSVEGGKLKTLHNAVRGKLRLASSKDDNVVEQDDDEFEDDGWGRDNFNYEEEMEKKFPGSKKSLYQGEENGKAESSTKKKIERPWARKETKSASENKVSEIKSGVNDAKVKKKKKKNNAVMEAEPNHVDKRSSSITELQEPQVQFSKNSTDFKAERRKVKHPTRKAQVSFSEPLSIESEIAIIGGGVSGIMCAITLAESGIRSTIFDTGKHGLGGRMATRNLVLSDGREMTFDHSAQFFTAANPVFQSWVDKWQEMGLVKEWAGKVGTLKSGGNFAEFSGEKRFIGVGGMRNLCEQLIEQFRPTGLISVERPTWISEMFVRDEGNEWILKEGNTKRGEFQAVVIAHNGKCANRLLATAGVPAIAQQTARLKLSSIWSLMAAFEGPLLSAEQQVPQDLEGAFVEGIPAVAWMANNTAKLQNTASKAAEQNPGGTAEGRRLECWTVLSTKLFGRKNKVPQESIPTVRASKVTKEMLSGMENALGFQPGTMPSPVFTKAQLWGAALPLNAPGTGYLLDSVGRVGVCGDWLLSPSVEGAALSGIQMGQQLAKLCVDGGLSGDFSVGLSAEFSELDCHDIGEFKAEKGLEVLEAMAV